MHNSLKEICLRIWSVTFSGFHIILKKSKDPKCSNSALL
jgi:hypothetical protein